MDAAREANEHPLPHGGNDVKLLMINLRRQPERRAMMTAELAGAGLSVEFVDAVDASDPACAEAVAQCAPTGPWGIVVQRHRGCTASHLKALRRFLESDATYGVIFEDDIFVSPDLAAVIADMSWWPSDADIVKLEKWRAKKLLLVMGPKRSEVLGRDVRRLLSRHMGAAAYVVTRDAAERILAHRPVNMVIDHMVFNVCASPLARALTLYQLEPAVVRQGNDMPTTAKTATPAKTPPEQTPPQQPSQAGQRPTERETGLGFWLRETKRAVFEISRMPVYFHEILFRGASIIRPRFEHALNSSQSVGR